MNEQGESARRRPDLTCPWWVVGILVLSFLAISYAAGGPNTLRIDASVSDWVQGFDGRFAEGLAELGDVLGERVLAIGFLAVAWVSLTILRQRRDLWFVVIATVGRLVAMVFKGILDSPRPGVDQVEKSQVYDGLGFPSGHATTSALLWGAVAYVLARRFPESRVRIALLEIWILAMVLTAYARIWHGAHWFTDTLGGSIAGVTIVLVAANLSALITREEPTGQQTPPLQTRVQ
jgi:undecaprenyl-diphosphatase